MNKKVSIKHILIIGIVSLLTSGIILSSNWGYFIKNNDRNNTELSSYQINTKNFYTNYKHNEESIIFQINILKRAISKNNFMYHNYNKVFKHNINYIRSQKNNIKNKISIANLSIKHEIDILSNMKNIIHNHPYNYLKFYQLKNYILPEIVSQSNNKVIPVIEHIETYNSKTNKSNISVSNISYQTEEDIVGIKNISSVISGANKLIFSKINFDYNNIFYYSNYSNNLTTLNEFKSKYDHLNNDKPATINKFITNNNKNSSHSFKDGLSFSFTKNKIINYIQNKPYVVAAPAAGLLGLGIIGFAIGISFYKYKKMRIAKTNESVPPNIPNNEASISARNSNDEQQTSRNIEDNEIDTYYDSNFESETSRNLNKSLDSIYESTKENKDVSVSIDNILNDESFFKKLYDSRIGKDNLTYSNFKEQITEFLYLLKFNTSRSDINTEEINSYINDRLSLNTTGTILANNRENPREYLLKSITDINESNRSDELAPKTKNGWFDIPSFSQNKDILFTRNEKTLIREQIIKFEDLLNSFPEYQSTQDLLKPMSESNLLDNLPDLFSNSSKIIGNQIINDLRELIAAHIDHLNVLSLGQNELEEDQVETPREQNIRVENYYMNFEETHLVRDNFNTLKHIGVTNQNFYNEIVKFDESL